ncbi:MAG: LysR family transcriptional regulator [Bariatricus sp.]
MNFEQIKSFVSVARTGSYSQAAKERYISQPAISNQIKSLEEELERTLFIRKMKKIVLTEDGKVFYKYANRLLATEKDIFNSLKNERDFYGILDVGAPYLTMYEQMDGFVKEMIRQKGEEVVCRINQKEDTDIPSLLLNGEIELGISNYMIDHNNLGYEEAFTEEIVLITPNEDKYRHLNSEQLKQLLIEEKHVRYDFGGGSDFLWNDFFGKVIGEDLHNIKTVIRTDNYNQQLAVVEAGLGIGFISSICMQKKWREGKILAYRCRGLLEKKHYVVYNKERLEESEVLQFAKNLLVTELRKSLLVPEESF